MRSILAAAIGVLGLIVGGSAHSVTEGARPIAEARASRPGPGALVEGTWFGRTELFLGAATPRGEVTDAEFQQFLDDVVRPRFPDGLTVLVGLGQFRGADGVLVRERSRVLILLYRDEERPASSERIEEIRHEYRWRFQQQSVLRSDRCCERVRF